MTRRAESRWTVVRRVSAVGLGVLALTLASCGDGEPEAKQTRTVVAPPPPPPGPLEQIRLNPKVEFPESMEPSSVEIAEAVADFASAFATGSASAAQSFLLPADRAVLDRLRESGAWGEETGGIELVRVVALDEEDATGELRLGLALQSEGGAYLLGWRGVHDGGSWMFTALPISSKTAASARALDGVDLSAL